MEPATQPSHVTVADASTVLSLTSIRDIEVCLRLFPSATIDADLHGIVTRSTIKDSYAFFYIHDGTGSVQVAARAPHLSETQIESCKKICQYDRLHLNGRVVRFPNRRTQEVTTTVVLSDVPAVIREQRGKAPTQELIESDIGDVGVQIFLARLRERAVTFFRHQEFIDLETRSISSVWNEEGVRPLRIDYPGYGIPVYLVPSPRTQLLKAIILTGRSKVFSVSRCYTPTYRDAVVSAESLFLCAQCLGVSLQSLVELSETAIRFTLQDISTAPARSELLQVPWQQATHSWPPDLQKDIAAPEIQVYSDLRGEHAPPPHIHSIFRVCWPPNVVLAEGAVETLQDDVTIGTVSIHLERLVAIISGARRQMQDLRQTQWISNW